MHFGPAVCGQIVHSGNVVGYVINVIGRFFKLFPSPYLPKKLWHIAKMQTHIKLIFSLSFAIYLGLTVEVTMATDRVTT